MNALLRTRDPRALVLAVALCSAALAIPRADADDFTDFRIPSNRALLWTAGMGTRFDGVDVGFAETQITDGRLDGSVASRLHWFSDSDPAFTLLDIDLSANGLRAHRTSEALSITPPQSFTLDADASDRSMFERWILSVAHRRYPWAMPLGFEVSANLSGSYSQSWDSQDLHSLSVGPGSTISTTFAQHTETWRYNHRVQASAAAGWGRVRNATGVYDALVLEQRLRETGAITRPLSGAGRQRLAEALYLRGALDTVHERPGRALWREIERVLSEDGALVGGGLDPYSVLRAAEPHLGAAFGLTADGVPISPMTRLTGAFAGLRLADFHSHRLERADGGSSSEMISNGIPSTVSNSFSNRTTMAQDQVEAGPAGEFHLPLGPPWQLDVVAAAMCGLRAEDSQLRLDSQASLVWLAADRWTATAKGLYRWLDEDRISGGTGGDSWQWIASMAVSWYVEDRTAIELSASHSQDWRRGDPPSAATPRPHFFARGTTVALGVTYRFAGWIAAPGFFAAPSAIPPVSP